MTKLDAIVIETQPNPDAAVIWLHGLGADGNDFVPIIPELNLDPSLKIRFIFPHAPIRPITLNGNMPMRAWFNIESLERLAQIDTQGILNSRELIETIIAEQIVKNISPSRIILAGFSQGGTIALFTGLTHQEPLGGILALSTYLPVNFAMQQPNVKVHHKPDIFLAHGEYDNIISIDLGLKTRDELQNLGYQIQWHSYPMAHQVCAEEISSIASWLSMKLAQSNHIAL